MKMSFLLISQVFLKPQNTPKEFACLTDVMTITQVIIFTTFVHGF